MFKWLLKRLKAFAFLILLLINSRSPAQPSQVSVKLWTDTAITSNEMTFHCTISNPADKNYKFHGIITDWERRISPHCWEISIIKDSSSFEDYSWQMILRNLIQDDIIKLKRHSSINFDFVLDFSRVGRWKDLKYLEIGSNTPHDSVFAKVNRYRNQNFGIYQVGIRYYKEYFDPKNPLTLESNKVMIEYRR